MKITADQYWRISYLQKVKENSESDVAICERDAELSNLRRRIHELERLVILNKISLLKQKQKNSEDDLVQYRTELAKELGLQSLDEYIIDTDTFELKHEKEI